ncbi:LacI family DNA-binding transcriptional regulator [Opitutus terrae]|uniref:Transcriptional regulator, LacI family n=1 Tax=Opitutus terrae (strain DSM 11246 / JCM 15787 / PB90-1) TaxID=452637 RepID=B1ZP93_OPITP|nr:LacI family DNA-binding transcriptional regulator [Opitutus terrae]ACB77582.1 transcriptional regulator, LacI family [Opitutus terrae PB90-1]
MKDRVTLSDVADRAGVHVTTVSLALRNSPRLPESTRSRLQALAKEMGYRPDPFLGALVAYRGGMMPRRNVPTLAYVTNWNSRWGWKEVPAHRKFFAGAESKANELGYKLEHFWLHEPGLSQKRMSKILYSRGIHGLIIASHSREMGDELQFEWEHFSAVKIDYFPHQPPLHNVTNNQTNVIRLAMRKVRAAGYRRIGFVVHRGWDHAVDHNWTAGYCGELEHLPRGDRLPPHLFPTLHPMKRWFNETNASVLADVEPFEKWLRRYRPEVIVAKGDYVLPLFRKLGLQIPRDVAFVNLFLEDPDGSVAGVHQNHDVVGSIAVEILAGQLQHKKFGIPPVATTTFVEGTWFDGASCPIRAVCPDPMAIVAS